MTTTSPPNMQAQINDIHAMKTQHTPGPWGIEQTDSSNWIGRMRHDGVKVDEIVTSTDRFNLTPEATARNDANARLIAAVPEVLEALRLAYVELNTIHARCGVPWWDTGKSDVTQEHFTSVVEKARAAIAKATGGQP